MSNGWTPRTTPPTVPEIMSGIRVLCCWTPSYSPEVLIYWDDGMWTDTCECEIEEEELPDYWMMLPDAPAHLPPTKGEGR